MPLQSVSLEELPVSWLPTTWISFLHHRNGIMRLQLNGSPLQTSPKARTRPPPYWTWSHKLQSPEHVCPSSIIKPVVSHVTEYKEKGRDGWAPGPLSSWVHGHNVPRSIGGQRWVQSNICSFVLESHCSVPVSWRCPDEQWGLPLPRRSSATPTALYSSPKP